MKNNFTVYSLIAWILCICLVVSGKSTDICDDKYKGSSNNCTSTCELKGEGLHHTSTCENYCICRIFEKRFYKIHRYCPEGMVFNRLIESCDSPGNYVCPGRPAVPAGYTCPQPEGKFAFPECCVLYIMCSHNVPYTFLCPSDTHFSVKTQNCEDHEKAGCRRNESTDNKETTASPTTTISTKATPDVVVTIPDTGFKCPLLDGHFPDHNNCNKYFHCSNGRADHKSCAPAKEHFNPSMRICDWPERAGCVSGKDAMDFSKPIGRCSVIGSAEGDENDCTKFYFCDYGYLFYESCPNGYYFNGPQKACILGVVPTGCRRVSPVIEDVCTCHNCNLPDPKDCRRYLQCVGGKARSRKCYLGQTFHNGTVPCDVSYNPKCKS